MTSVTETEQKRQNRTVTIHLGNTLAEYQEMISTEEGIQRLIRRVEIADSLNWGCLADRHKEGCLRRLHFTHHDEYKRGIRHFDGTRALVDILRVRCLECEAVFSIQPSFIVRYKRYDTDAIEKFATLLFITEASYRMASVSQALGIDTRQEGTWVALEGAEQASISPMALWDLMQWLGQLSPAQLNLALGVEPPTHVIEDEKHAKECGQKAYVPIVYAPKEALIWWIDYIHSVSEDALHESLERFKALSERLAHIVGATVDGWDPAQKALQAAFPGIILAECHFHAEFKLGQHLATYKRQCEKAGRPVSEQEETNIRDSFSCVLNALTPEAYQEALDKLPDAFEHAALASRKDSLIAKQALFQAWTTDDQLALVSTALDQCMKFLNRKLDNMQTLHGSQSGLATVNAWAITRNCWRFLKGAKRAGLSPLELAGADFLGIPWMQLVNLVLCAWPSLTLAAGVIGIST
jgi:hypothetical protein